MYLLYKKKIIILLFSSMIASLSAAEDLPCSARSYPNRSVVCVCNSSYCDTVTRVTPESGYAYVYTSSEAGLRFEKTTLELQDASNEDASSDTVKILVLDLSTTYQSIEGFGGAISDSAAMNWKNLSDPQAQQYLIESYFSSAGIQYNMLRAPIGATDFSLRGYSYNDYPMNDTMLTNFTLQTEDTEYKIPMIKACMEASETELHVVSSCWSPPEWMKTYLTSIGSARLLTDYYESFAYYYVKFIESYNETGITIWAVTTGNEPINGLIGLGNKYDLGWTLSEMASWVKDYLSPILKNNTKVKLLGVDDQRYTVPLWINLVEEFSSGYVDALDGVAVHFYADDYVPASLLTTSLKNYPNLFLIGTEASILTTSGKTVDLGSWERGEKYINDIIEGLNNNYVGWIDWNVCLNMEGGPSWLDNYLDSPIIVNADEGEFYKQPMFYGLGHFSKFIPRNSVRIGSTIANSTCSEEATASSVAFLTPEDTVVTVMYNAENVTKSVLLKLDEKQVSLTVGPKTIITVEMSRE